MSLIVAGRFTTFPAAEAAAQQALRARLRRRRRHAVLRQSTGSTLAPCAGSQPAPDRRTATARNAGHSATIGAVAGAIIGAAIFMAFAASLPVVVIAAGVGAYLGFTAWVLDMQTRRTRAEHHDRVRREFRNSGVLVAVHVCNDNQLDAAAILREAGGTDLERASGHWRQGRWADFDPTYDPGAAQRSESAARVTQPQDVRARRRDISTRKNGGPFGPPWRWFCAARG